VLTGVSYITDKLHYHFTDRPRKQLQNILESKLPGNEVVVTSMSKDEARVLVRTYSDRSMGAYYYCDLTSGQVQKLADVSPWLDDEDMSSMQPVQFQSRDGLTLHGYLTLPKGVNAKNMK
jgi:dipeptidyl aminopeptidase/acylaminoacyl peptidase